MIKWLKEKNETRNKRVCVSETCRDEKRTTETHKGKKVAHKTANYCLMALKLQKENPT